MEGLRENL